MLQGKIVSPTTCDTTSNAGYKTSLTPDTNQNKAEDKRNLSQIRLEEYNMQTAALDDQQTAQLFVHQKQSSYAQSEGYYSYVSSSDSSSTTPFLERLRHETDSPFNPYTHAPRNDFNANSTSILEKLKEQVESNVVSHHPQNNNWEVSSSTETLKWLGSVQDVYCKNSVNGSESVPNAQLIVRSSRVMAPKRHHSESVLCTTNPDRFSMSTLGSTDSSLEQLLETTQEEEELLRSNGCWVTSSRTEIIETVYKDDGTQKLNVSVENQHDGTSATISPKSIASSESKLSTCESLGEDLGSVKSSPFSDISKNSFSVKGLPLKSESSPSLNSTEMFYRSNNRLFPLNTYSESSQISTVSSMGSPRDEDTGGFPKTSPPRESNNNNLPPTIERLAKKPSNWQTVAELINDFESSSSTGQPNQKFSYLEPSKIHRVSNSSLKVLQKTAVHSYIERQKQQQIERKERGVNKRLMEQPQHQIHPLQRTELTRSVRHGDAQRSSLPNVNSSNWPQPAVTRMYASSSSQNVYKSIPKEKTSSILLESSLPPPPPPPRIRLNRRSSSASDCRVVENVSPAEKFSFNDSGMPPPPPPRNRIPVANLSSMPDNMIIKQLLISKNLNALQSPTLGNGTEKTWAPERPPKKPSMRLPSPELPPPPPSDPEINYNDEPLPPPPPEIMQTPQVSPGSYSKTSSPPRRNSFTSTSPLQKHYTATPAYASNEGKNPSKMPPPTIPKKPISIQKLNNFQNASNNRKRPHFTMQTSLPAHHSPSPISDRWSNSSEKLISPEHNFNQLMSKPSPSPPPLAPKTFICKGKPPAPSKSSRCNSKASYLTIQPPENDKSYNLDHGSYKLTNTLHEEDFSIDPKFSSTKDMKSFTKNENIPCNLPDVLPAGALQIPNQTTSFKILEQKGPEKMTANIEYRMQPENKLTFLGKEKDRHSISVLDRDNSKILNDLELQGFNRSQSYDAGAERQAYSLESNRFGLNESKEENKPKTSQQSMSRDYIRTHRESNRSFDETLSSRTQQLREEHLANCLIPALKRQSISRQQSLRENIEKISQLQSQLMSTHISNSSLLRPLSEELPPPSLPTNLEQSFAKLEEEKPKIDKKEPKEDLKSSQIQETKQESPKIPEDSQIEGLKFIQRSEIVLRVGSVMVETACQTDDLSDLMESSSCSKEDALSTKSNHSTDDQEIEEDHFEVLTKELVELLSPDSNLLSVLNRLEDKTSKDYVSNLYNTEISSRSNKKHVGTLTLLRRKSRESPSPNEEKENANSCSDFKAKESESPSSPLSKKLEELIQHLISKLKVLSSEQSSIQEQSASNEVLGNDLLNKMGDKMRASETTRVRTYIDDVGHITSLLLSLSERLAKIDNTLNKSEDKSGEKNLLERKKEMLKDQLEEASRLKNDIERRGENITTTLLEKNLTNEELDDYNYFINMKAKLIVDARDVAGKILLNEEQLNALKEALTTLR